MIWELEGSRRTSKILTWITGSIGAISQDRTFWEKKLINLITLILKCLWDIPEELPSKELYVSFWTSTES